ncbi:DUF1800 family protein [Arcobacter sp. LA11]|uniref:DUF1800 domain-containing protein n=1 Tax=Arcobacter sp. LA11 TaxID=1898176 RepID=UPI0009322323|nr:DUF1800 domain-containing protein [Arcobacter sp. LA11]
MKLFLILSLFFINAFSLTLDESKHLLNRTSFGYTKKDLKTFQNFSKEEAVDYLLKQANTKDIYKKPRNIKEVSIFKGKVKELSKEERKKLRKQRRQKMLEIQTWWHEMILDSRFSFREKMTLFWHNHFTSEYRVVKSPYLMFKQNMLYRENALGKFDELLHKSSKDLAMLIYLDSNSNKKSHPNENYARELLELFTLGEGNYTENDIKEAARAFTGLRVNRKKDISILVKKHHDNGIKTFKNHSGNFNGTDIINIVLKEEQVSKFIVQKLYKEFINEKFNIGEVERLALIFRKSNYDISILMKNLLLSDDFWIEENMGNMIKSPVELIASLVKSLNIKLKQKDYKFISKTARNLGQDLFNPPNVKGWEQGKSWIDSTSLVNRSEFIKLAIKRRVNNKNIKSLKIKDFSDFKDYFYALNVEGKMLFKNNKKNYLTLLSKPIYNLK